jgi:hypothetical protein
MNTDNFMVQRYADVPIYAEATLGTAATTTDASALDAVNKVRARAELTPLTEITLEDIMHERRVEFAFEGDYWYDIQRQGFAKAKEIIESQNRGTVGNSPVWMVPVYVTNFTQSMMFLPIPASESLQDPMLLEPPVSYYDK